MYALLHSDNWVLLCSKYIFLLMSTAFILKLQMKSDLICVNISERLCFSLPLYASKHSFNLEMRVRVILHIWMYLPILIFSDKNAHSWSQANHESENWGAFPSSHTAKLRIPWAPLFTQQPHSAWVRVWLTFFFWEMLDGGMGLKSPLCY